MLKVRCPNCGLKASGDYCQWCHYPILRGKPTKGRKAKKQAEEARKAKEAEKQAKIEAERTAKEKVRQETIAAKEKEKQDAIEAKKAKEAEKQAKIEAEERAKREAEKWAKQLESIREELNSGKIGTKEAIERFKAVISHIKLGA